ncbi:MAG TPA: alpha/beta hydrolase [Candidatus Binatia bacterium]|nr:alpha/beta hydrolase [Candidatus Binatia bacterium]
MDLPPLERRRVDCGEVSLECRLGGPEDAPLVVFLHGFPESWYSWRHQIAALAPSFRVAAPMLRGYGESDRPAAIDAYRLDRLVGDVRGLVRALGRERAIVVAHDWGGGVAWALAMHHPDVCEKLVVCNCPHPAVMTRALRSSPRQLLKSWYMFFFQLPALPEWMLSRRDFAAVDRAFRGMVRRKDREVFSDHDLAEIKKALRPPGALNAAVNYYRAAFRNRSFLESYSNAGPIRCPTLLIWGEDDDAVGKELTHGMEPLFAGPFSVEYVPDCSHWVQQERPEAVNRALLAFLGSP